MSKKKLCINFHLSFVIIIFENMSELLYEIYMKYNGMLQQH